MPFSNIFNKLIKNIGNKIIEKDGLLHNRVLLYATFVFSLLNLVIFMVEKDFYSITFFILIGFLTTFFSKNMLVVLLLSLILTNILKYGSNLNKEGMDEDEDELMEGMEKDDEEILEGLENEFNELFEGMEDEDDELVEGMEDEDDDELVEGMENEEEDEELAEGMENEDEDEELVEGMENEDEDEELVEGMVEGASFLKKLGVSNKLKKRINKAVKNRNNLIAGGLGVVGAGAAAKKNKKNKKSRLEKRVSRLERRLARRRQKLLEKNRAAKKTDSYFLNLQKQTKQLIKDENDLLFRIDKMRRKLNKLTKRNKNKIIQAPNYI
jgi:hypothetical protein